MKCTLTFTVGGENITLDLETDLESPLTDQEIIDSLNNNESKRIALSDLIHKKLYNQSRLREATIKNIINKEGILGNCNLDFLKTEFSDVEFPEGVDANILIMDNLHIPNTGGSIYGRVINSQGQEVFLVTGKRDKDGKAADISKLAYFLKVRQQLQEQAFRFAEDSSDYKDLQKILTERNKKINNKENKLGDIYELMLDFHYNKNWYIKNNIYIDGKSAYSILNRLMNVILQYSQKVEYSDGFVNTINEMISWRNVKVKEDQSKYVPYLSVDGLYNTIKQYHPEILKTLDLTSKNKFNDYFSQPSSRISNQLQDLFGQVVEESAGYATLLKYLFDAEPEFTLIYESNTDKTITLKSIPKTIETKYGISYDTIHSFDIIDEDYKGYKIYSFNDNGETKYIPSRNYLTEDTIAKIYNTEEEVRSYIDSSVEKQDIKKNSFIDFKFRNKYEVDEQVKYDDELNLFNIYSNQSLITGSVIESLDVPLVKNTRIYNGENILFTEDRQNYSSFKKIIEKWNITEETKNNILTSVNNAEKIAIFIYKINELLNEVREGEDAEKVMNNVIDMIANAPKKLYYIDTKTPVKGRNQYLYKVIPTNPIQIDQYKKQKRTPVITLISAISKVIQDKFNVSVNMRTSEEIIQQFPDIDANTAKAFIRDGQIYINTTIANSSDLFHEYSHLLLGILKSNPNLRGNYEQLLYLVASKVSKEELDKLRDKYEDISQMDLMEELFVKKFSEYIMNTVNPDLKQIFISQDKFLKDATKIIFNNEIDNLQTFYGKSLDTIFMRFSSDVASLLETKGLDFSSTKTSRLYSNWISKQIKNGEIKEECYG